MVEGDKNATSSQPVKVEGLDKKDREPLLEYGLKVANIVSTIDTDREFNLEVLTSTLSSSEYDPEHSPFLVYRPKGNSTLLVPTNGLISIVGSKRLIDIKKDTREFIDELEEIGIEFTSDIRTVTVQNIVVSGSFPSELDLSTLAIGIGLERCEYEREQFPGLIFRSGRGGTILLFRTGAYLITGISSYDDALEEYFELRSELNSLGIETGDQ